MREHDYFRAQIFDPRTSGVGWTGDDIGQQYAGTKFSDNLDGGGGNDTLFGAGGIDFLTGGADSDRLVGGAGDDVLEGGAGADRLEGGDNWDVVSYEHAAASTDGLGVTACLLDPNWNAGEAEGDTYDKIEAILGSAHKDTLVGNDAANVLAGGAGNDVLEGAGGADRLDGGEGWDLVTYLYNSPAEQSVVVDLATNAHGGAAAGDVLVDIEVIQGTNVGDWLYSANGPGNELLGEMGDDRLTGRNGADTLRGGDDGDWLYGNDNNDWLHGDAGADELRGGANNDWLFGGEGADFLDGGDGWDVLSYQGETSGIVVDMTTDQHGGAAAGDRLTGIEVVQGTASADTITGLHRGGGQGVELLGMAGADFLQGKEGADTLDGGDDTDTAVYAGNWVEYNVFKNADSRTWTVVHQSDTDLLREIEYIRFKDRTVSLGDLSVNHHPDMLSFTDDTRAKTIFDNAATPVLGTLKAHDSDIPADPLFFFIHPSDGNQGKFTIVNGNQLAVASGTLAAGTYTVKVQVSDGRGGVLVETFTITSQHANVAPVSDGVTPSGAGRAGTDGDAGKILMDEDATGFEVAQVAAHDTDGGTIGYALTTNPGNLFAIDATTGIITAAPEALQVTQDTEYALVVTISDGQGGTTTQNVAIKIKDVNRAPVIDNLSGTSADEDDDVGTEVGVFAVHDPDGPSTDLVFELVNNAEGRFAVDGTGRLTLARALTHADVGTYQITLRVSDKGSQTGSLSTEQTFTITVNDVVNGNHAPDTLRLNGGTIATVNENALFEGALSAQDDDGDTSFTWSFDNAAGHDNALFEIDNQTKMLKLKAGVDYEALALNRKYLMVYLKASDGKTGGTSATQAFKINIEGIDEAPDAIRLKGATAVTLDENTGTDGEVGLLSAHDPEGRTVTYTLAENAEGRFKLDATGTRVLVADGSRLDYEALPAGAKYYDIKVVAADTGPDQKFAEQIIRINLNDKEEPDQPNRAPTDVTLTGDTVFEYTAAGTSVGTLSALDADNDPLTYTLTDNAGGRFMLSGRTLVVADGYRLDFEQAASHSVTVAVSDGKTVVTKALTVTVKDVNPEVITGTDQDDTFLGGARNDKLSGGLGNDRLGGSGGQDTLDGGAGADRLEGGTDNDTYFVDQAGDVVVEGAGGGFDTVLTQASYTLAADAEVEVLTATQGTAAFLTGNAFANAITGHAGADQLKGLAGDDVLTGGSGHDRLSGGLGRDVLTGDAGKDVFVFDTAVAKRKNANIDTIKSFSVKDDGIWLDNAIFTALGRKGSLTKPAKLKKDAFYQGSKAHDGDDRIVYNKKTGALSYDADGNGSKAAIKIATLSKNLKLTEKDFFVI